MMQSTRSDHGSQRDTDGEKKGEQSLAQCNATVNSDVHVSLLICGNICRAPVSKPYSGADRTGFHQEQEDYGKECSATTDRLDVGKKHGEFDLKDAKQSLIVCGTF